MLRLGLLQQELGRRKGHGTADTGKESLYRPASTLPTSIMRGNNQSQRVSHGRRGLHYPAGHRHLPTGRERVLEPKWWHMLGA